MRRLIAAFVLCLPCSATAETGEAIYASGGNGSVTLAGGQVKVAASRFPCANCHGADARGGAEGATEVPPIIWTALSRPGRQGGSYDLDTFARLVRHGIRPDGGAILSLMPRYDLSDGEVLALATFLRNIERQASNGITQNAIHLPLPADADFADGLQKAMKEFNGHGGAYGRELVLVSDASNAIADGLLYDRIGDAISKAEQGTLLSSLSAHGVTQVRLSADDPDLIYRLAAKNLKTTDDGKAILALSSPLPDLKGKIAYLTHRALEGANPTNIEQADALFVAMPQEVALASQLMAGRGGRFIDGYLAGLAIGKAVINGGRTLTASEIASDSITAAQTLEISVHQVPGN